MNVDLYDTAGKKAGKINLPEAIFKVKINSVLLAQSVRVYLANQRQAGNAKAKTRHEVIGSRAKIYKQKGTGRARHGDRKAPIFVGGGVAHGPTGRENYKAVMSKKMRRLALFSALSAKLKQNQIVFVKDMVKLNAKTSSLVKTLNNLGLLDKNKNLKNKTLLILPKMEKNLILSARNLKSMELGQVKQLNTWQVLKTGMVVFLAESLPVLKETFMSDQKVKLTVAKQTTGKK